MSCDLSGGEEKQEGVGVGVAQAGGRRRRGGGGPGWGSEEARPSQNQPFATICFVTSL